MTCLECRDLTLEVARRRAAPFVERAVLAHAAGCDACRSRLAREQALTAALAQVARDTGATTASTEVEHRLMAAFAAQAVPAQGMSRSFPTVVSRWCRWRQRCCSPAGIATWWGTRAGRVVSPASPLARSFARRDPDRRSGRRRGRRWRNPLFTEQRRCGRTRKAACHTPAGHGGATAASAGRSGWLRADPVGRRTAGVRERRDRPAGHPGHRAARTTASTFRPARRPQWRRISRSGRTGRRAPSDW